MVTTPRCRLRRIVVSAASAGANFNFAFVPNISREAIAVISTLVCLQVVKGGEVDDAVFGLAGDAVGAVAAEEGGDLGAGCVGGDAAVGCCGGVGWGG